VYHESLVGVEGAPETGRARLGARAGCEGSRLPALPTRRGDVVLRLAVDFEHPSRAWWENGGQELWDGITEGFEESKVVLDDDLAASWLAEARRIPGWDDGPEYAPHPVTVAPVDPDEQFE
jgi:hypothetical protein